MIDRKFFYDSLRKTPIGANGFKQSQIDGYETILSLWAKFSEGAPLAFLAYILATAYHETAFTMQPVSEYGKGKGKKYGIPDKLTGETYYGRGYVQLTWKENYANASKLVGVDLVRKPELACAAEIAGRILIQGMLSGMFTGKSLWSYWSSGVFDPVEARRIVNGVDKATQIAGYYRAYLTALIVAKDAFRSASTTPAAPQRPPVKPVPPIVRFWRWLTGASPTNA